ncbi:ABC transporter substrate-binding protein [Rhodoligotrophos defluvii]|uniref:ABC transporter substrate-binding protein n=1 Tax=Rhodoligotrophos defluvii TaxID=2561934 RepID=UPI0010C9FEA1|nr:ABC transporter substrate-binding protein [Rhodoligotrophos defluvii]
MHSGIRHVLLASAALAMFCNAAAAEEEFKVGGVVALSGPYGVIGEAMRKGAELAAEMRGGKVLGAPIVFEWEDSETKPQVAVQKATRLIADGADLLFGEVSSGATIAMMKLAERRKVPLLVTISASDEITGKDKNPYTFRTSNPVDMENRMMAEFAAKDGVKRVYGVVADYAVGREMWESLKAKLKAKGVTIAGEDFPALGNKDYSLIADKVAKSDADGVAMIMTGSDAITFLKQSGQIGLKDKKTVFGTMVMDELMGKAVGEQSYGVNSTLRYHFSHDNPANEKFVAAFKAKYGELPNQFAGEAFDGMSWFLNVVDETGRWDKEAWLEAFRNSTYAESVEGTKRMRPCDNQAEQVGLFGKAVKGSDPLPPVTMEVTYTFEPSALFDACE